MTKPEHLNTEPSTALAGIPAHCPELRAARRHEIGYRIDPYHQRRGHARAALETLLAGAAQEPDVHRRSGQYPAGQPAFLEPSVAHAAGITAR
ncbi:GNAT family N-acetyltransferase [Actinoplanes sp. ATCC 53533]|uniref:GNAT family N-acetyltransferase n=1 Tax=Actinoplanes sp. ATCC 53533 TaxID=1288362 RepID=UPI000F79A3B0|nr:GNAT family protein [Actinoplanes sp. ATCC 53533]